MMAGIEHDVDNEVKNGYRLSFLGTGSEQLLLIGEPVINGGAG